MSVETGDFRANRRLAQRLLAHRPIYTPLTSEWGQVRYTGDGNRLLVYDGERRLGDRLGRAAEHRFRV